MRWSWCVISDRSWGSGHESLSGEEGVYQGEKCMSGEAGEAPGRTDMRLSYTNFH